MIETTDSKKKRFDTDERQELTELFSEISQDVCSILAYDDVLPSAITYNRENVGITIKLRKFYEKEQDND